MKKIFIIAVLFFVFAAGASYGFIATPSSYPEIVVVIDPGHGGNDSGATGPSGVKEKVVVLEVAKQVKKELIKRLDARIILTREDDVFLTLEERTMIANASGADMFISIHANAAYRAGAEGVETFFLSYEASDSDTRKLVALENNLAAVSEKKETADDLTSILRDMTQTESHHESFRLAELVHTSLVEKTGVENRGVKQAPFFVLVGAAMPAVLVEVGFISNPEEEKRLTTAEAQTSIAEAIAEGIIGFKNGLNGQNRITKAVK